MIDIGQPEHSVVTTCAYCGVGCSFKAEMRGEEVVRMVPYKDGKANRGHSCVKGRFAWGYATHQERILKPMVRDKITDPWRETTWEEAIGRVASEFKRIQDQYGRDGRRRHHLVALHQRGNLPRAEADPRRLRREQRRHLRARLPLADRLRPEDGVRRQLAGTQDFDSVEHSDVMMVIGANPTDGHPVFASRMKKRLREGAKLIVVDPRRIDLVRSPHVEADYHLPLQPGTNVAVLTAMAHVIVTEGLVNESFVRERCDMDEFKEWAAFVAEPSAFARGGRASTPASSAELVRGAARLYATGGNAAIYYGLGVTEHSQGSTTVMAIANLAMATGNLGRPGVGVNPLRGQNNVQGACDMGSFPHELSGYRHISDDATRADVRDAVGLHARSRAGPAHPQHARCRRRRHVQGHLHPGRGHPAVRPQHAPRRGRPRGDGMRRRAGSVPERDRQLRARLPARLARSSRRTARSPTPSAASSCVAR